MRKTVTRLLMVFAIASQPVSATELGPRELQQATHINTMSSELLRVSLGDGDLHNTMVSSVSMFYALSMLELGALEDSQELLRDLLLTTPGPVTDIAVPLADALVVDAGDSDTLGRFALSNSVWASNGATDGRRFVFASDFIDAVSQAFDAEAHTLDFLAPGAATPVNTWADAKTHGLIPKIVDDATMQRLTWLIINAAYFEGAWKTPMYRRGPTEDYRFTTESGERQAVDTVNTKQLLQVADHEDGAVSLAIPFSGNRYHLVLQLPPADVEDVGAWLRNTALPTQAEAVDAAFSGDIYDVQLRMPVFSYSNRLTLKADTPATEALGLLPLFTDEANLRAMADQELSHPVARDTKVGLIQQDTRIELDEKGVKAAAVTMIGGMIKSTSLVIPRPQRQIVVDRPFAWSIVEGSSRTAIFSGVVATPEED